MILVMCILSHVYIPLYPHTMHLEMCADDDNDEDVEIEEESGNEDATGSPGDDDEEEESEEGSEAEDASGTCDDSEESD